MIHQNRQLSDPLLTRLLKEKQIFRSWKYLHSYRKSEMRHLEVVQPWILRPLKVVCNLLVKWHLLKVAYNLLILAQVALRVAVLKLVWLLLQIVDVYLPLNFLLVLSQQVPGCFMGVPVLDQLRCVKRRRLILKQS